MKTKIFTLLLLCNGICPYVIAQTGTLDHTFGRNGTVTLEGGGYVSLYARKILIQADGKIVVAGSTYLEENGCDIACDGIALFRLNPDGTSDSTFSGGRVNVDFGAYGSGRPSIAIQMDGKIIVAGAAYNKNEKGFFAIGRYNSNGSPDSSFGVSGFVLTPVGKDASASSVAIQSDGKIVVAGSSYDTARNLAILRYNTDGSLDTTFSHNGKVVTALGISQYEPYMTLQPDGKIVVTGSFYNGSKYDIGMLRYNTDGSLDKSFGTNGIVTTDLENFDEYANSIALQSDGKILIGMRSFWEGNSNYSALLRYNADGSLDSSFDKDGLVIPGMEDLYFNSILLQPDGKILVGGGVAGDGILSRYNINGSVDSSFGDNGIAKIEETALQDWYDDFDYLDYGPFYNPLLAIQKDWKIVVAGTFEFDEGHIYFYDAVALERFNGDGTYFKIAPKVSYTGNAVLFTDQSTNATSWKWDLNADGIFDSEEQNPVYAYSVAGVYNVKLRVNDDPLSEVLVPLTILPNRGTPYTLADGGNFETNPNDFAADNLGFSTFRSGSSAHYGKDGTNSGSTAWVIDINDYSYISNSIAYLYTPSFNCTAAGDYTISFYAKYEIENEWDGFRIEYSTDKGNSWKPLGTSVQAEWYDYDNPDTNRPFPQGEAYFSLYNSPDSYTRKTFTTNVFQGNSSVAFRLVFKSDPYVVSSGLAIDDFTLTGPTNIALPVTLISLSGFNDANKNILNWKTSTEINSSHYEVERSLDGNHFEKIGSVPSSNNINGAAYAYSDNISHVLANNFYYRLKMVDKDVKYNYSSMFPFVYTMQLKKYQCLVI